MLKNLDSINYLEELKKFNVKSFPESPDNYRFQSNSKWTQSRALTKEEKLEQAILIEESAKLKGNEVRYYISHDNELIFVSSDFIVCKRWNFFEVMDNLCNQLYFFGTNGNCTDFYINNSNVKFQLDSKNKAVFSFLFSETINSQERKISFSLKDKNSFSIYSDSIGLSSIKFTPDTIKAKFKGSSYSSMVLDYNFNIKEVELSRSVKAIMDLDKSIKYHDIKNYTELMTKIKESLKDNLDLYSLINDVKFKFKGSEQKFERDISYIKELTAKRFEMSQIVEKNDSTLKDFFNYYNQHSYLITLDFSGLERQEIRKDIINNSILSKYTDHKDKYSNNLLFLILNEKNDDSFMKSDMLNRYKDINNKVLNLMRFNKELISLKKINTKKSFKI